MRQRFPVLDRTAYELAYAETELAEKLGELLHRVRSAAGISEAELAERTGTTQDTIVGFEEGAPGVTVAFLDQVGRVLGVGLTLTVDETVVATDTPDDSGGGPAGTTGTTVVFGAPGDPGGAE